jgi:hypothetical protein
MRESIVSRKHYPELGGVGGVLIRIIKGCLE